MNRVYFAKVGPALMPADEDAERYVAKLGAGEQIAFKPLKIRNLQWHRRYWGLLSQLAPHINQIDISWSDKPAMMPVSSAESLHTALKLITGHCDTMQIRGTDMVIRVPRATNFDEMSGDEWSEYYPRVLDAIHERALPQVDVPGLEDELARLAS